MPNKKPVKKVVKKIVKKCSHCNGKGYYTQLLSLTGRGVFEQDIYKIACPTCNWRNEQKIEGVRATALSLPLPKSKK